jgi:hypothetical protein
MYFPAGLTHGERFPERCTCCNQAASETSVPDVSWMWRLNWTEADQADCFLQWPNPPTSAMLQLVWGMPEQVGANVHGREPILLPTMKWMNGGVSRWSATRCT